MTQSARNERRNERDHEQLVILAINGSARAPAHTLQLSVHHVYPCATVVAGGVHRDRRDLGWREVPVTRHAAGTGPVSSYSTWVLWTVRVKKKPSLKDRIAWLAMQQSADVRSG